MKDPICTRCGELCGGFFWEYKTVSEHVFMCDNCSKYALLYFMSKGRLKPHELAHYVKKKLERIK